MTKIEIPRHLIEKIDPEKKMDVNWIDVKLSDGSTEESLVVRGGQFITGKASGPDGEGELRFSAAEIVDIRPHRFGITKLLKRR